MKRATGDQQGFTLVELLVVMLIIAILAEIAIPSFIGQAAKGDDAQAKSAVYTAQQALETYRVDHDSYCGATAANLISIEQTLADADNLTVDACPGANKDAYALTVRSRSTVGTVYAISLVSGAVVQRTCNTPGEAGCSASGTW